MSAVKPKINHWISYKGIKALKASHPGVRKIRREGNEPSLHGNKVWRSSFVLIDYLHRNKMPEQSRVLDVGCGWGLTGIYLAKRYSASVLATDADESVGAYLRLQAELNKVDVEFRRAMFEDPRQKDLAGVHTLIGSDVCFWEELVNPLLNLLRRANKAGVKRCIIADPGRPPFWELAEKAKKSLGARVVSHSIRSPWRSEKELLIVGDD